jgi:hypothetical protein
MSQLPPRLTTIPGCGHVPSRNAWRVSACRTRRCRCRCRHRRTHLDSPALGGAPGAAVIHADIGERAGSRPAGGARLVQTVHVTAPDPTGAPEDGRACLMPVRAGECAFLAHNRRVHRCVLAAARWVLSLPPERVSRRTRSSSSRKTLRGFMAANSRDRPGLAGVMASSGDCADEPAAEGHSSRKPAEASRAPVPAPRPARKISLL